VNGILATQIDGSGAGTIERSYKFIADAFGFTNADHDDLFPCVQGLFQCLDGLDEAVVETSREHEQLGCFYFEGFAAFGDEIHSRIFTHSCDRVNPSKSGDLRVVV
jgi:hypothetical protein